MIHPRWPRAPKTCATRLAERLWSVPLLLLLLVVSCVAPRAVSSEPAAVTQTAAAATPTTTLAPTASPSPTRDDETAQVLQLLAARDEAQRAGDEQALLAVLDTSAAPEFRDRELALLRMAKARGATAPKRTFARRVPLDVTGGVVQYVEVVEDDDQGRTRRMRYFASFAGGARLTEPTPASIDRLLGPLRSRPSEGFMIRYRDVDADQAAATEAIAKQALSELIARLGEPYRQHRPFTITLAPTAIAGLPAPASGYVDGTEVTLLSSQSMVVTSGPGAQWARKVVTHEISHVLLFARGGGPWALVEGIPLWLTDDRRQPELDRLVAADAIWDLPHLLEGPRSLDEFFAGYAQASSFVRYLADRHGAGAVIAAWEAGRAKPTFDEAFRSGFGASPIDAWSDWKRSLTARAVRVDPWPVASLSPV